MDWTPLIYWGIIFPPTIIIFFKAQRYFFKRSLSWGDACNRAAIIAMFYAAAVLLIIVIREVL